MWLKDGNLISVLIKLYLFWRVTETALCHYADLGRGESSDTCGYGENARLKVDNRWEWV